MTFLEDLVLVPPTDFPPFIRGRLYPGPAGSLFQKRDGLPLQGSSLLKSFPGTTFLKLEKELRAARSETPSTAAGIKFAVTAHPLPSDSHWARPSPQPPLDNCSCKCCAKAAVQLF